MIVYNVRLFDFFAFCLAFCVMFLLASEHAAEIDRMQGSFGKFEALMFGYLPFCCRNFECRVISSCCRNLKALLSAWFPVELRMIVEKLD